MPPLSYVTISGSDGFWQSTKINRGIHDMAAEREDAPSRDNVIKSSLWDSDAPGSFPLSRVGFVSAISCSRFLSPIFSTFSRRRSSGSISIFFLRLVFPRICVHGKRLPRFVRFLEDLRRMSLCAAESSTGRVSLSYLAKYILTRLFNERGLTSRR